jgi:putative transcription antitermination factor YqgF
MNYLAIDFGTKNIGLAYTVNDIIFTLKPIPNDSNLISNINKIIIDHSIGKIYIGLSYGKVAKLTKIFIDKLSTVVKLPIETVEESVSTIEADRLIIDSRSKKQGHQLVDSVAAAVILRRVIN